MQRSLSFLSAQYSTAFGVAKWISSEEGSIILNLFDPIKYKFERCWLMAKLGCLFLSSLCTLLAIREAATSDIAPPAAYKGSLFKVEAMSPEFQNYSPCIVILNITSRKEGSEMRVLEFEFLYFFRCSQHKERIVDFSFLIHFAFNEFILN